jgi:predicted aspartyl protease
MKRRTVAAALLLAVLPGTASAACAVRTLATVPMLIRQQRPTLGVAVNGEAALFILDTGAVRTMMTEAAVARLPRDEWVSTLMRGAGNGLEQRRNVVLRSLTLGGEPFLAPPLAAQISLPVTGAVIDQSGVAAGLLGRDFLRHYDLGLDFQNQRLTLARVVPPCTGLLPWGAAGVAVPFTDRQGAVLVAVEVDGVALEALLDTGAAASLINARGLHKLGLAEARLAGDPAASGFAIGGAFSMRMHGFGRLALGPIVVSAPRLAVAPLANAGFDMILGMDVMAGHRLWISYGARQVIVAGTAP